MKRLCVALMCVAGAARAQTAAPAEPSNAELKAHVDELERRLGILSQELESERTGSAPATVAPPTAPLAATPGAPAPSAWQAIGAVFPPVPPQGAYGLAPSASKVYSVKNGLSIGGYGETIGSFYNPRLQNGAFLPTSASLDTLRAVLYVGYKFTDWLVLNSEFEFEHSGVADQHLGGEAVTEFAYLDFLLARGINIRVGHLLLPVGFINEIHEPPTFLGARRPAVERDDGIIPTTWNENGLGIHGALPARIQYRLYVVNGLNSSGFSSGGIGAGRQDGHLAIFNKPAVTGRVDWNFIPGAFVGGSFYTGDSNQGDGLPIWTTLFEFHGEYRDHGVQIRALYAHVNNSGPGVASLLLADPARQVGTEQSGGYVEVGYDVLSLVPTTRQAVIPFVRYENLNTQQQVVPGVVVTGETARQIWTVGANYKPIPQVALKADYNFQTNGAGTGQSQANVAVSYLF